MNNDIAMYEDATAQQLTDEEYKYAISQGFIDWLYNRFTINNGHMLVPLLEDGDVQLEYLADVGLPADTELEI